MTPSPTRLRRHDIRLAGNATSSTATHATANAAGALLHTAHTAAIAASPSHALDRPPRYRAYASPVNAANTTPRRPLRSDSHATDSAWLGCTAQISTAIPHTTRSTPK